MSALFIDHYSKLSPAISPWVGAVPAKVRP